MKADIACSIEIDNTTFISKYMTHVKGVKCQVILDSHFCNITVTGVGHRLWREYYFSKAAHSIFKRHLQDTDERDTEPSEFRSLSSGEESIIESSGMTSSEESSTGCSSMTGSEGSRTESSSIAFTEDSRIFPSENRIQPIHISTPNAQSSRSNVCTEGRRQQCDLYRVQYNDDYGIMNQQRGESDGRQLSFLVAKIGKMESEIQELRRTVISLMQTMIPTPTYSEAVNRKNYTATTQSQSPLILSEETRMPNFPKDATHTNNRSSSIQKIPPQETPKAIPVIISQGSKQTQVRANSGKQQPVTNQDRQPRTEDRQPRTDDRQPRTEETQQRVLLLGDSIIKGVNTKGLANGVHKHSISGGNIQQLIDEINHYDLKVFSTIIIYIGGNNVARGDNPSITEEKYDELISLIKCSNRSCKIILCSIAPRTDADVSNFNQAVAKLAMHWRCQNVDYVSSTHDMFFKDGELSTRYFHHDGIHLTASGTKRLLDALNRGFQIVKDFDNCVFTGKRNMNKANIGSGFHVPQ